MYDTRHTMHVPRRVGNRALVYRFRYSHTVPTNSSLSSIPDRSATLGFPTSHEVTHHNHDRHKYHIVSYITFQ